MDRVPLLNITGSPTPWVGTDLPIGSTGTSAATLTRGFLAITDVSTSGDVVVEIRDASSALLTLTIPAGSRSVEAAPASTVSLASGVDLFMRVTSAGTGVLGLQGWFELSGAVTATAALTDLARVKEYLGITGSSSDSLLSKHIAAVSKRMQEWMRRRIVSEAITGEKYDASGLCDVLQLRTYPLISGSATVTLNGTALTASEFEEETAEGHLIYTPTTGTPSPWPGGRRHIVVDYTAGFAAVPDDLVMAATIQAAWDAKRSAVKGDRLGERTVFSASGETGTNMIDAWAPEALDAMRPYRAHGVA